MIRIPDKTYLQYVLGLYGRLGHEFVREEEGQVDSDYLNGKLMARADYRLDTFGYYVSEEVAAMLGVE